MENFSTSGIEVGVKVEIGVGSGRVGVGSPGVKVCIGVGMDCVDVERMDG